MSYPQFGANVPGLNTQALNSGNAYNPTGGTIGPTMSPSATTPTDPKQQYIQTKAQTMQPAAPTAQTPQTVQQQNQAYFNANPSVFGSQPTTPPPAPQQPPATPVNTTTDFTGTSTGTVGQGVYDPYNSPAYQQYLNQYINSQLPGLTTPQIQSGQQTVAQGEQQAQQRYQQQIQNALNGGGSSAAVTGESAAAGTLFNNTTSSYQNILDQLNQQQGQAGTAYGAGVNAANANAGYLGGLATPTPIGTGQQLTQLNPSTGQLSTLGGISAFASGTNSQTGAPYTYNQQTGAINNGGTGLGTTPPALNGDVVAPTDPYYSTLQTYAGLLASNQPSAVPMGSLPPAVQAQVLRMAQAQGYNANTAAGVAAAQQSNTQVAGTAAVDAAASAYPQYYKDYLDTQSAATSVDQFGSLLTSGMVDSKGDTINPSSAQFANTLLKDLRGQLSSSQQGQFDTTYAALKSKLSGLLAVGGSQTPTQLSSDVNGIINGSMPLGQLQDVLSRIKQEGQIVTNIAAQKGNTALQQAQGNNQSSSSSAPAGFGWNP